MAPYRQPAAPTQLRRNEEPAPGSKAAIILAIRRVHSELDVFSIDEDLATRTIQITVCDRVCGPVVGKLLEKAKQAAKSAAPSSVIVRVASIVL